MLARRWKINYSLTKNWLSSFFSLIYWHLVFLPIIFFWFILFLTTQKCARLILSFFYLSKWQYPRHIGTKNIKYSSVSLFAKYLIALGRFESQTNSRQDLQRKIWDDHAFLCRLHANTHLNLQYNNYGTKKMIA